MVGGGNTAKIGNLKGGKNPPEKTCLSGHGKSAASVGQMWKSGRSES